MLIINKINNTLKGRNISDISFSVKEGDVHAIIGNNGAGKTTIVKSLLGVIKSNKVDATLFGDSIIESKNQITYISDKIVLPKDKKVIDYLIEYQYLTQGIKSQPAKQNARSLLKEFGMDKFENNKMKNISSGEIKKIQIIASLSRNSKVVILDEPFTNLDHLAKLEFIKFINSAKKRNIITIIISHEVDKLASFIDAYTFLRNGKVIETKKATGKILPHLIQMMEGKNA